jgi:molybdate transport system substrate-binding protein
MRPVLLALALVVAGPAFADEARIAVAANFTEPAREIAAAFKEKTGHVAVLSFGSSGAFVTQIEQAAPFDVFLSADAERPRALEDKGLAVAGARFTYAVGKLALWSRTEGYVKGEETLRSGDFAKIAIANPVAAPYGSAAVETLKALGLYDAIKPRIVEGSSIGQAFQFAGTGNAELGFVALAQTIGKGGSRWIVPQALYSPILQDAVMLKTGAANAAATAFFEFVRGPEARAVIEKYGYDAAR